MDSSDEPRPHGGRDGDTAPPRFSGAARVAVLTAVLAVAAAGLHLGWVARLDGLALGVRTPWWLLAPAFAFTEVFVAHVQVRREAHSLSLSELPTLIALFLANPGELVLGRLLGSAFALLVLRRQPPLKAAFNLANFWLESALAVVVFRGLLPPGPVTVPGSWGAAFATSAVIAPVVATNIALAIYLSEGRLHPRTVSWGVLGSAVTALTSTALGLVIVGALVVDIRTVWPMLGVAVVAHVIHWAYASLRLRHGSLEQLYGFIRAAERSLEVESVVGALLSQARELVRAEVAELVLLDPGGGAAARLRLGAGGDLHTVALDPATRSGDFYADALAGRPAVRIARPVRDERLRRDLSDLGLRDAMVAPLRGAAGGVIGAILVGDRLGDVGSFHADDLGLLETLATHAGVSLENSRLVASLRREAADKEYQAGHDALTGLLNRTLFQTHVEQAIAGRARGVPVAVMLLDLDRFKEVNDTLGHRTGDLLLEEVGERLRGVAHDGAKIARLGGDEFAILLPRVADTAAAAGAAGEVRAALERPFVVGDLVLDVTASVGIALCPQHGEEGSALLQRADVAMYAAKAARSGLEVYDSELDQCSPERLGLVAELRRAIESGALLVHYQPKVGLRSGRVTGVEALLRWHHPAHGFIPPEEFVLLAERTGLIRDLTRFVLRTALAQRESWRRAGRELDMAVNLSVRNLLNLELVEDVAGLIAEFGVPPGALTLEITESSIMADHALAVTALSRLGEMGVKLSIDDFGTGYSSLSYLKRLPVDEVKIDKSFVTHMATDDSDAMIVRAIVDLGHNLGVQVVAEGVEDDVTWRQLTTFGCDVVQGYLLSRPLAAAQLWQWVAEWEDMRVPESPSRPALR